MADYTRRVLYLLWPLCISFSDAGHIAAVVVGLASSLIVVAKKYFPSNQLIFNNLQTLTKNIFLYLLTKRKHCITFVLSNAEAIPRNVHHSPHTTMLSDLSPGTRFTVEFRPGIVFVFSSYDAEIDTANFREEGARYDNRFCPRASTIPVTIL